MFLFAIHVRRTNSGPVCANNRPMQQQCFDFSQTDKKYHHHIASSNSPQTPHSAIVSATFISLSPRKFSSSTKSTHTIFVNYESSFRFSSFLGLLGNLLKVCASVCFPLALTASAAVVSKVFREHTTVKHTCLPFCSLCVCCELVQRQA